MSYNYVTRQKAPKPYAGIYAIVNLVTGERYVGQAQDVRTRLKTHFSALNCGTHPNSKLQAAFDYYGALEFVPDIVELAPSHFNRAEALNWMNERERFHILAGAAYNSGSPPNPRALWNLHENGWGFSWGARNPNWIDTRKQTRARNRRGVGRPRKSEEP